MTKKLELTPEERQALCEAAERHLDLLGIKLDVADEEEAKPLRAERDALLSAFRKIEAALSDD